MPPTGEFGRIDRHFKPLAKSLSGALDLSDDAALLSVPPGHTLVLTTDAMVEGVHYLAGEAPERLARKALRVNLSDLAAMGARPLAYLLTLALPSMVGEDWLAAFADGLGGDQARFGIQLAGGDSVSTPGPTTVSITAIGAVPDGAALRRSGARPGDRVWVSGTVGDGVLGLLALRGELKGLSEDDHELLADRYRCPTPRLALGEELRGHASAAIDISDGLVGDLGHICRASGVGATLAADRVPISDVARAAIARDSGLAARALAGGDDYELLFTTRPSAVGLMGKIAGRLGVPLTCIGEIIAGDGIAMLDADGRPMALPPAWEHFRAG